MQKHTNRTIVALVLLAAGVTGGFFVFMGSRQAAAIDAAADDAAARIERMTATAGDIASAQHASVAPGQPAQPWLERGATLLHQFGQDAVAIRPLLQKGPAAPALDEVDKAFKAIVTVDGKVRDSLQEEQHLLASDLIFSEGHETAGALVGALGNLDASARKVFAAQRAAIERQQWTALGAVAIVWLAGLMALAPLPGSGVRDPGSEGSRFEGSRFEGLRLTDPGSRVPDPGLRPPSVDLAEAADICGALARTTDTDALREAIARAATLLDARGIIVWMGAGEELFPALSHGYDERVVERLGPIPRNAENATAEAWRTAQLRTVASNQMFDGALAAPVSGVNGCVGVLAAEVRNRREDDPAIRAVAAMFAAQLAGIMPAWPAASSAPETANSTRVAASRG
jgi:hypothetical protein